MAVHNDAIHIEHDGLQSQLGIQRVS
jgi:hypothetical protein